MEHETYTNLDTAKSDLNSVSRLSDDQIELIADIFSKGNHFSLADQDVEWLLSHAFQLGAKFYREFTECK